MTWIDTVETIITYGVVHTIILITFIIFGIIGPIVVYGNKNR